MDLALCVFFIEGDLWEERLHAAAPTMKLKIDEYNRADIPLPQLLQYRTVVVAMDGLAGLRAVRAIRAKSFDVPLLWISDEDYSRFAYQNHVTHFLLKTASDTELQRAVKHCLEEKGRE